MFNISNNTINKSEAENTETYIHTLVIYLWWNSLSSLKISGYLSIKVKYIYELLLII